MPVAKMIDPSGPYVRLLLISFVLLFFELACIRWFGSTVVFLTFFTNIVLLATFLGMSVGCLSASTERDWTGVVLPLFLLAAVLACGTLWSYNTFGHLMVDVGGQGSPQQVYFGTEYRARDLASFAVPVEVVGAAFFVLIALIFVGIGQAMGRAFNAAPDRLKAYSSNIAGSLAGIAAFAFAAYLRTPPLVWFAVVGFVWISLNRPHILQIGTLAATLVFMAFFGNNSTGWRPLQKEADRETLTWSPYYKIQYSPPTRQIITNNISHQQMGHIDQGGSVYQLPYWLNRDSGAPPFQNVLIVGAGSGNDVAAALLNGVGHVDAVEIDPSIYEIGRAAHPNHPYQDPRVSVHVDDGRSFLRNTTTRYDLIVFALVDSLVLHSGYSSIRLESFLFTEEAFEEVASKLTPKGFFAAYNYFRQGWIVGRIDRIAEKAFGTRPVVLSLPYIDRIKADASQAQRLTFILAGRAEALTSVRREFDAGRSFWLNSRPAVNAATHTFTTDPPAPSGSTAGNWDRLSPASVETLGVDPLPTDDWPFLYLRQAVVPALNLRSIALLAVLSMIILSHFAPQRATNPNWHMFFLGAGFMLLETTSVVHLALLFGSTWVVNSIVFFAILVMVLGSNLFVLAVRPRGLASYYGLLFASLVVDVLVPTSWFLTLPGWQRMVAASAVTFLPVFFGGIVFGASFRDSSEPDLDFGSNIAGAMLGGLAESLSLVVGFDHLLLVALACYLFSSVFASRRMTVSLARA